MTTKIERLKNLFSKRIQIEAELQKIIQEELDSCSDFKSPFFEELKRLLFNRQNASFASLLLLISGNRILHIIQE